MSPSSPRAEPVWLDRRTPPHVTTLVAVSGIAAINMNVILPSLPSIATHYNADYALVALAVSAYLALTALLNLLIGPMSDRFGRRPVLLVCFAVFFVATVGCLFAPNIGVFLAFRMLQAVIAVAFVLSRAVVRDMVGPGQAASMISYVTMGMSLAPMLAPVIGGWLDQSFGWQAVFIFTLVVTALIWWLVWADMGETNLNPTDSFGDQARAYPELIRSQSFWGYALSAAFASGAFFAFVGGGAWVASEVLGMGPAELGFHFGFIALGYMFGNFLSGRYAARAGLGRMMLAGGIVATLGLAVTLGLLFVGNLNATAFFGTIALVGVGNGLLLPSANAGMVSVRPQLAGSASGLGGALAIGTGAGMAVLAGALLGPGTGAWPLIWLMFASSAVSILTTLWVIRRSREGARP